MLTRARPALCLRQSGDAMFGSLLRSAMGNSNSSNNAAVAASPYPSLVSHTHGRMRREERGIERAELQEAVKYGKKERANPGRRGDTRWRYTHKVWLTKLHCMHARL